MADESPKRRMLLLISQVKEIRVDATEEELEAFKKLRLDYQKLNLKECKG